MSEKSSLEQTITELTKAVEKLTNLLGKEPQDEKTTPERLTVPEDIPENAGYFTCSCDIEPDGYLVTQLFAIGGKISTNSAKFPIPLLDHDGSEMGAYAACIRLCSDVIYQWVCLPPQAVMYIDLPDQLRAAVADVDFTNLDQITKSRVDILADTFLTLQEGNVVKLLA